MFDLPRVPEYYVITFFTLLIGFPLVVVYFIFCLLAGQKPSFQEIIKLLIILIFVEVIILFPDWINTYLDKLIILLLIYALILLFKKLMQILKH
jgi:hypothetical protein